MTLILGELRRAWGQDADYRTHTREISNKPTLLLPRVACFIFNEKILPVHCSTFDAPISEPRRTRDGQPDRE